MEGALRSLIYNAKALMFSFFDYDCLVYPSLFFRFRAFVNIQHHPPYNSLIPSNNSENAVHILYRVPSFFIV